MELAACHIMHSRIAIIYGYSVCPLVTNHCHCHYKTMNNEDEKAPNHQTQTTHACKAPRSLIQITHDHSHCHLNFHLLHQKSVESRHHLYTQLAPPRLAKSKQGCAGFV